MPDDGLLSIDEIGKTFASILNDDNLSLLILAGAFWILFYGVFVLAFKKSPFAKGEDNKHLIKIISGSLSAIIVLASLVVADNVLEYAKNVMGSFNFIFAAVISVIVFIVFKYLLHDESKKVQYQAGLWGLLASTYLFSSISLHSTPLTKAARDISGIIMFILLLYAIFQVFVYAKGMFSGFSGGDGGDIAGDKVRKKLERVEGLADGTEKDELRSEIQKDFVKNARKRATKLEEIYEKVDELDDEIQKTLNSIGNKTRAWTPHHLDSLDDSIKREAKPLVRTRDDCVGELLKDLRPVGIRCEGRLGSLRDAITNFSKIDPSDQKRLQNVMGGIGEACAQISHALKKLHSDYSALSEKVSDLNRDVDRLNV